jgi:hypothetical protein
MENLKIFIIIPFKAEFKDIHEAIKQVVVTSGNTFRWVDDVAIDNTSKEIEKTIKNADIIIADVSEANPNVMYELGFAQSMQKPVITICQKGESIPFDLNRFPILLYDRKQLQNTLIRPLYSYFSTKNFGQFIHSDKIKVTKKKEEIKTVFISYSHEDISYLKRLSVHLRPFEKNELIDLWVDTKIKVGEKWKEKIKQALDKAALAILLISADFLASDFIVDNELPPLLQAAEEKGKLILPVILKPCRFTRDENLSKFQAINDPKIPLSRMDENDREEVYVKIADYIDSMVKSKS